MEGMQGKNAGSCSMESIFFFLPLSAGFYGSKGILLCLRIL